MDTDVIVAIIGVFGMALGWLADELRQKLNENNSTQKALKILLRREIKAEYEKWSKEGYITHSALAEFKDTIDVYNALVGNNGYVEDIENKINSLEVRE